MNELPEDDSERNLVLRSRIYNNLGNTFRKQCDSENAFKYYYLAISLETECNSLFDKLVVFYNISCFNLGSMLLEKGDILNGITYIDKSYIKTSPEICENIVAKGYSHFFDHPNIIESIFEFYRESFNGAILKLKEIYNQFNKNPIINFFIGIYYMKVNKPKKALCFFEKLVMCVVFF